MRWTGVGVLEVLVTVLSSAVAEVSLAGVGDVARDCSYLVSYLGCFVCLFFLSYTTGEDV